MKRPHQVIYQNRAQGVVHAGSGPAAGAGPADQVTGQGVCSPRSGQTRPGTGLPEPRAAPRPSREAGGGALRSRPRRLPAAPRPPAGRALAVVSRRPDAPADPGPAPRSPASAGGLLGGRAGPFRGGGRTRPRRGPRLRDRPGGPRRPVSVPGAGPPPVTGPAASPPPPHDSANPPPARRPASGSRPSSGPGRGGHRGGAGLPAGLARSRARRFGAGSARPTSPPPPAAPRGARPGRVGRGPAGEGGGRSPSCRDILVQTVAARPPGSGCSVPRGVPVPAPAADSHSSPGLGRGGGVGRSAPAAAAGRRRGAGTGPGLAGAALQEAGPTPRLPRRPP